jgi:hypothetical protein
MYIGTRNQDGEVCGLFYRTNSGYYELRSLYADINKHINLVDVAPSGVKKFIREYQPEYRSILVPIEEDEAKAALTQHQCYMDEIELEIRERLKAKI